jgi:hypothetical protein
VAQAFDLAGITNTSYGSLEALHKKSFKKSSWSHSHRGFSPVTLDSEVTETV